MDLERKPSILDLTTTPYREHRDPVDGMLYHCKYCDYKATSSRATSLHAANEHHWRAAPWHFTYDTCCPVCMHQHHTRSRLVHHLARKQSRCLTTPIHIYPPLTLAELAANAEKAATQNPTGHESLPRLMPATRVPGPLPYHDITGLSADRPFDADDNER